ncbi:MAG: glycosyl hydrolase family 18 protein [Chryseolinea sp.]
MKVCIGLILLVSFSPTFTLKAQRCDAFVGGYIPSWHDPSIIDYSGLSHTFYAFAATNNTGDLIVDNPAAVGAFKIASDGTQRFLSLAGGGGAASYTSMTASSISIASFVTNCISFCKSNNFQGIDVDWEGIVTAADSAKYGRLMRALSAGLHSNDLQLVATIGYGSYGGDFYNVGALNQADWIQVMVYDQTGTWSESPFGNHASFQHVLNAIGYWTGRGYSDVSKMVIGLPFYGYKFNSYSGGLATAMTYSEIVGKYPAMACDQDQVGLIVFNGPETIRKKVQYVKQKGLKGVMIWEMSQDLVSTDNKSLMKAISLANCDQEAACFQTVTDVETETRLEDIVEITNPVDKFMKISFHEYGGKATALELIDTMGRSLFKRDLSNSEPLEIDLSQQAAGLFYLKVSFADDKRVVKKILKL